METLSPQVSISLIKSSISSLLGTKKLPIDRNEWEGYFDESGHLVKSKDFISSNILDRGLDPSVRPEAWKFLTGYYPWRSSWDERLTVDGMRRKSYDDLCRMYEKIQPLLETEHRGFMQARSFINSDLQRLYTRDLRGNAMVDKKQLEKILLLSYVCNVKAEYQQGFHEMLLLFQLLVEKEHEIYWLFQFFLQKTEHGCVIHIGVGKNILMLKAVIAFMDPLFAKYLDGRGSRVVQSLFPWFCLYFQRVFKSFDDVWRLWEVFLTGKPCRNFQVFVAYTMLQMVRDHILREAMSGDDILMVCNSLIDLDADELISEACSMYEHLMKYEDKIPGELKEFFT
ncbi:TBC1 domain family member 21 [Alligator mississippiensis]|uniref:TBC1 domain family member 21 isoform A n=1 Tax=Alligator mississippiensis TaxID=8496 RepID=A0A151ML47_ALLMI|nr:TBC1 domain family member 21 [Alligator mississippiensis]XP_059570890.1 TBC1 domain family member 21 [Alligator mississippiensis]KYO25254.1 TBC1 domain family member 21 isoform A [Alligator mississippiensis]